MKISLLKHAEIIHPKAALKITVDSQPEGNTQE
jgi:hypothetical protein